MDYSLTPLIHNAEASHCVTARIISDFTRPLDTEKYTYFTLHQVLIIKLLNAMKARNDLDATL